MADTLADGLKIRRLGDILKRKGVITDEDIEKAKDYQKKTGVHFGDALIAIEATTDFEVAAAIADQTGLQFFRDQNELRLDDVDKEMCDRIGWDRIQELLLLPLTSEQVVVNDPFDPQILPALDTVLTPEQVRKIQIVIAPKTLLRNQIDKVLSGGIMSGGISLPGKTQQDFVVEERLNKVIMSAYNAGASDVHIIPFGDEVHVMFRESGLLKTRKEFEMLRETGRAFMVKVKEKFHMDIAKSSITQGGGGIITMDTGEKIDIRASIEPGIYGEIVVLRLLVRTNKMVELDALSIAPEVVLSIRQATRKRAGQIVFAGPVNSGKTTTIYACLREMQARESWRMVLTIEDPVEYRLPFISKQIQVVPEAQARGVKISFADALREAMRQDSNIIFVGEIRDKETAEYAARASLTGLLVLTTIHARNSISALLRLKDLGVDMTVLADTLALVVCQYLEPTLCPVCTKLHPPTDKQKRNLEWIAKRHGYPEIAKMAEEPMVRDIFKQESKNCQQCGGSGYYGRVPVSECLRIDGKIIKYLALEPDKLYDHKELGDSYTPLLDDILAKIRLGVLDLQTIVRYL